MNANITNSWIAQEFSQVKLGDVRLEKRLKVISSCLLNSPGTPIHQACKNWNMAKGAYRLFDNYKLTSEKLMEAHHQRTKKRIEADDSEFVFAIQDTTEIDFTHHPQKKGLGTLTKNSSYKSSRKGFLVHSTLVVDQSGNPLGLVDQKIYKRTESKGNHKQRPIIDKESYRWIESLRKTDSLLSKRKYLTICDREADIYEFFLEANQLESLVLVRSGKDRLLVESLEGQSVTLRRFMQQLKVSAKTAVSIPSKSNQTERFANLEVRYSKVKLKAPQRSPKARHNKLWPVELYVVWFNEPNSPDGCTPLDWMLLTTLEISDVNTALSIGKYYKLRWQIECFHRVLKSGCRVESSRLGSYEKLTKFISVQSVISIRLFQLTYNSRVNPSETCEAILSPEEWKTLDSYLNKRSKPQSDPPNCKEATHMIARLGGFLGRKGDQEPGMTYIWRGWEKLTDLVEMRRCVLEC